SQTVGRRLHQPIGDSADSIGVHSRLAFAVSTPGESRPGGKRDQQDGDDRFARPPLPEERQPRQKRKPAEFAHSVGTLPPPQSVSIRWIANNAKHRDIVPPTATY